RALQENPKFSGMSVTELHALYPSGVLDAYARQPSELYEFMLEGVVMFALLYGCFRFAIEFIREPDAQLGYLFHTGWLTMGQVQSIPLIVVGLLLLWMSRRAPVVQPVEVKATSPASAPRKG